MGRSRKNDIILTDKSVSNRHLKVYQIGRRYFIEDLKSTNGTRINEKRLDSGEGFEMAEGDLIRLGRVILRIEALPDLTAIENMVALNKSKEVKEILPKSQVDSDRRRPSDHGIQLIQNVAGLIKQSFNLQSFCRKVLEYILHSLPRIDTAALAFLDPLKQTNSKNKTLILYSKPEVKNREQNAVIEKIIDRVLERRKAIRLLNAAYEYSENARVENSQIHIKSVLCIPLISNSVIRGALYIHSTSNPCGFRKEDLNTLNTLSASLAVIFEKALLYGRPTAPLPTQY